MSNSSSIPSVARVHQSLIEKETVFATACHKISSPWIATQAGGSTAITGMLTSGSELLPGILAGGSGCREGAEVTAAVVEDHGEPSPSLPCAVEAQPVSDSAPLPAAFLLTGPTARPMPP